MQLDSPIEENFRLVEAQKKGLKKLGLKTVRDLLFYFPSRHESFSERKNIVDLQEGDKTTIYGKVTAIKKQKAFRKKLYYTQVTLNDNTGTIDALWFNQPYVVNILKKDDKIALTGKVTNKKGKLYINNPTYERVSSYENLGEGGALLPVYPETRGITSRWLRASIQKILKNLITQRVELFRDPVPAGILKKYNLPSLQSALIFIHTPQKIKDAEAARKRFAFEEIFFIQLARLKERHIRDKQHSPTIDISKKELDDFLKIFPFDLTSAQKRAINSIINDMKTEKPMSRLLEGDVGSGKTAVAVAATYALTKNGYQVAYMAPTEILAQQHFKSFIDYFSQLRLTTKIGLMTSSECRKYPSKVSAGWQNEPSTHISKNQLLKWVENGEIPIVIGTHSLIQKSVKFPARGGSASGGKKGLGLVIIDEQHRFGTKQRATLAKEKSAFIPHLLSMTATPIPRTLALTIYSDLDLSLLDEMPAGRKKVETIIVPADQRSRAYEQIRHEMENGRQAYIICPRIEEPDETKATTLRVKSVKAEAKRLEKDIFPEFEIGIIHGKLKPKEKEEILNDFRANKIQVLVSTSVIEVGIDVPNSTMIVIEGAERFGLAQLHQLRGRVMRSSHQPYCFVFTSDSVEGTPKRLEALAKAKNGFELAEYDLQFRGAGELYGAKQWGVSDIAMEALKNIKMVEAARNESQKLLQDDPELKKYPQILERLKNQNNNIHFE